MEAFDAYRIYLSVKLHFTTKSFDCIKYNFKTNANYDKFINSPNTYWFNSITKRFGDKDVLANFFISQFVSSNGEKTTGNFRANLSLMEDIFLKWTARQNSITETFNEDIGFIVNQFPNRNVSLQDIFLPDKTGLPKIATFLRKKQISPESVVYLDKHTHFVVKLQTVIKDPVYWDAFSLFITKYGLILNPIPKFKQTILDNFEIGVVANG